MPIKYENLDTRVFAIRVLLDGKPVGMIRQDRGGQYYYAPYGSKRGELFATVGEVKRSLEAA